MQLQLDNFGRIVIPKRERQRLGLKPGSKLVLEPHEHGLLIRRVEEGPRLEEIDGTLIYIGDSDGDLEGAVHRHRHARLSDLGGDPVGRS